MLIENYGYKVPKEDIVKASVKSEEGNTCVRVCKGLYFYKGFVVLYNDDEYEKFKWFAVSPILCKVNIPCQKSKKLLLSSIDLALQSCNYEIFVHKGLGKRYIFYSFEKDFYYVLYQEYFQSCGWKKFISSAEKISKDMYLDFLKGLPKDGYVLVK